MSYWEPRTFRTSYEWLLDLRLANPTASQEEIARLAGRSHHLVTKLEQSDMYKERLAIRRAEVVDPELRDVVAQKFRALEQRSLDILAKKLSKEPEKISDNLALRCAELGAKVAGRLDRAAPPPPAPSPVHLEELAERLVALQNRVRSRGAEDAEVIRETGA